MTDDVGVVIMFICTTIDVTLKYSRHHALMLSVSHRRSLRALLGITSSGIGGGTRLSAGYAGPRERT